MYKFIHKLFLYTRNVLSKYMYLLVVSTFLKSHTYNEFECIIIT